MGSALVAFSRIALASLGFLLIWCALFLNETEEGRVEGALQASWIRIRDLHVHSISRETAFVKIVTDLTTRMFARVFGERFWVTPAPQASLAYSTAAFLIFESFVAPQLTHTGSLLPPLATLLIAICLMGLGSLGPFLQRLEAPSGLALISRTVRQE